MAGFSLLALLDDISTVLDDVALLTKMAAQKTVGVVGDDLALTAQQLSGLRASRELPVVWAVGKGSLINKCILIPLALIISAFAEYLIAPLLMIGGAYLCYEGAEKVWEKILNLFGKSHATREMAEELDLKASSDAAQASLRITQLEKKKIKGAVRTDFVLSAEIITIALGTIPQDIGFWPRAAALVLVGFIMTVGVYGFVALVVKLDDLGFWLLSKERGKLKEMVGKALVGAAPYIMRFLGILGTIAMFLVGGSIIYHDAPIIREILTNLSPVLRYLCQIALGLITGFILLPIIYFVESGVRAIAKSKDKA
ncbi:MAG: DUF808 domain-containing protein [Deltaproteobacteria bacterium]|jgi:predicted DNA repair protein MutK|nr:DUF808 domain-containing protein [Deltaproteobacteria bacterium]